MRDKSAPADRAAKLPPSAVRKQRLADALRDNLQKRKAQQRVRREASEDQSSRDANEADGSDRAPDAQ